MSTLSPLHVRPQAEESGRILHIDPRSAAWDYVGFEVFRLESGARLEQVSANTEVCIVIVSGFAHVSTGQAQWPNLGARKSPFEAQAPFAVYVPPRDHFVIEALSELEIALCKAPAEGRFPARLITPPATSARRRCAARAPTGARCATSCLAIWPPKKLLVVEVITPAGHWSSYPPHKHDRQARRKCAVIVVQRHIV